MEDKYLSLGKIIDTFSLDGSVKVFSTTTNQDIRYKKGNKVIVHLDEGTKELTIEKYRRSSTFDIVKFVEINSATEAEPLKGYQILVIKNQKDLKEGYYFYSDLVGCEIIADGKSLGKVIAVEEFPAQITLRVEMSNGKTFFVPFIKQFIKKVDIDNKTIEINYMEGLI